MPRCVLLILLPLILAAAQPCAQAQPEGRPYNEAPMLRELVEAGQLPPVEERLPENPYVMEPVHQIGEYGGTWRRIATNIGDMGVHNRLGYVSLLRWDRSGRKVVPDLAEEWSMEDGGRRYIFHLRKGVRWSDGKPFTTEDLLYIYEDVFQNQELYPIFPDFLTVDGEPVSMSAPDAHTLVMEFSKPYGVLPEMLAYAGYNLFTPKHYMTQFHADYTDEEELLEQARDRGFDHWRQLYLLKSNLMENPELPTIRPFRLAVGPPATRWLLVRNPYYWKVDPEGNQLPYIDEISFQEVPNGEILNFKAMAGEVDFQSRRIDAANYPLFMANREQEGYRVKRDISPTGVVIYLNQNSRNPRMRRLIQDKRFRVALSLAINRAELIDVIFTGMAKPSRCVASSFDPYYLPEFNEKYLEYDPARANALLDELGLKRGRNGMRRFPNGDPFREILHLYPTEAGDNAGMWQLVAQYWREVGLDFTTKLDAAELSVLNVTTGKTDFWAYLTAGLHWSIDPVWYVPWTNRSYFAPLYGQYHASGGKAGVKPPPEIQILLDRYRKLRSSTDPQEKLELGRAILRQWAEECYTIGLVQQEALTIVSDNFKNVPDQIIHSYRLMVPGYIGIEQFYFEQE
jgi:peptide/nickel transport system substrate-binding protein